jgi:hypothetical protein
MLKTVSLSLRSSKYGYEALFAFRRFVEIFDAYHSPSFGGFFEILDPIFRVYSSFPPPNHHFHYINEIKNSMAHFRFFM